MASPQVCGVLACLATGKDRFNQEQAFAYLEKFSKDGDMTFNLSGGGLGDNTCSFNSPDKYLLAQSPREIVGYIKDVDGRRKFGGQTYPRSHRLFSEPPTSQYMNVTFTVVVGSGNYVMTGTDRVNTFTDAFDPTIRVNAGDKIVFTVDVSGHPLYIKTAATTGTGDQVQNYQGSGYGVLNNGIISGDVSLYTEGLSGTTLYYICEFHSSMQGQIIIS